MFNKHIKNEISCCVVGSPVGREMLLKYCTRLLQADSKSVTSVNAGDVITQQRTSTGSTGTTEQRRKTLTSKKDYVSQKYVTTFDGQQVYARIQQIYGANEQMTSPKLLTQKSDGFLICVGGEHVESSGSASDHQGTANPASSTGI